LPTIITHCSNNFGPNQYPEKLIPFFVQSALEGKPLPVYGDGKNVRDWIYVEDHCHGLYLALTQGKIGQTYCFGGDKEVSNIDLVKQLCHTLDKLTPHKDGNSYIQQITFVEDRLGHDRRYAIDNKKVVEELNFARQSSFEEAFEKTLAWYINAYQAPLESKENSAHA
jgi:dTDP-glucose 4,6-dehydratase